MKERAGNAERKENDLHRCQQRLGKEQEAG